MRSKSVTKNNESRKLNLNLWHKTFNLGYFTMEVFRISKELSTRLVDGRKQVLVRVNLSRTNRPRFKSGVFVNPSFFIDGDIVPNRRGRKNADDAELAKEARIALNLFCQRLTEVINVGLSNKDEIDKVWIETVMDLYMKGKLRKENGSIVFESIQKAILPEPSTMLVVPEEIVAIRESGPMKSVYSFFNQYCSSRKIAHSRAVTYKALARIIFRFEMFERMVEHREGFQFRPDVITEKDLLALRNYMRKEGDLYTKYPEVFERIIILQDNTLPREVQHGGSYGIQNKSDNYIVCMLKKLRSLQNWLKTQVLLTDNDPFAGFEIGVERRLSHPVYLTREERNLVAKHDFSYDSVLETNRDIFIFQCMTGCRYEDLRNLTPANITGRILEYIPMKTVKNVAPPQPRVPLTDLSMDIISKYSGMAKDDRLLPCYSVYHYNLKLKEIFKACGLNRMVFVFDALQGKEVQKPLYSVASSHMARRTFIGISYKMTKDPNIIASMSGHVEGSTAFNRYRDIDDEIRMEVISLIE